MWLWLCKKHLEKTWTTKWFSKATSNNNQEKQQHTIRDVIAAVIYTSNDIIFVPARLTVCGNREEFSYRSERTCFSYMRLIHIQTYSHTHTHTAQPNKHQKNRTFVITNKQTNEQTNKTNQMTQMEWTNRNFVLVRWTIVLSNRRDVID